MNAGDVVVLNFPFSDLSGSKPRPAVVIAQSGPNDFIACQITSQSSDPAAVELKQADFAIGGLQVNSFVRPGKLFTAHRSIISRRVGKLGKTTAAKIKQAVITVIQNG